MAAGALRLKNTLVVTNRVLSLTESSESTEFTSSESADGVMIFGGGESNSINEKQFNELKSIVLDLRTSIIEGS